ncbi:protein FAM161A isoform X3 [Gracilinanus agilis]|uniref:protein FAM161A isoform X3 n=1 Tax=Gracilinanus agilis TaxID=191870 RepID=UPI001CFCAA70|nr:protein FAM161A isoform X3 [Gracilinanus agilis]
MRYPGLQRPGLQRPGNGHAPFGSRPLPAAGILEASHRAAVLAMLSFQAPLDPHSRTKRIAFYKQACSGETSEEETPPEEEEDVFDIDLATVDMQRLHQSRSSEDLVSISEISDSDQEYYRKLEELKAAHKETMAKLEELYQSKLHLKPETMKEKMPGPCDSSGWISSSCQPASLQRSFSEPDLNQPSSVSVTDASEYGFCNLEKENTNDVKIMPSAKEYIRNMWVDFSVKNYPCAHSESSDSSLIEKPEKKPKIWVPKITVPEPFQMTIREERKKKECLNSQAEKDKTFKQLKMQEEQAEKKRFRANPVPESVFLPLYHELLEKNEERRRNVKERCREILLATQRPFAFIAREELKKAQKMQLTDPPKPEKKKSVFKARPVPRSTYSSPFGDKLKEEEFLRELQEHLRTQLLLQNASLPRNMWAHQSPSKRKLKHTDECGKTIHGNKVRYPVPDFKTLHVKFQKQFLQQKNPRPTTVCEPFDLLTLRIPSKKEKILEDIQADEECLKETRWPYLSPRGKARAKHSRTEYALCEPSDYDSPRATVSSRMRQQAIRRSLEEKKILEEEEKRILAKQRKRMRELQKRLMTHVRAFDTRQSLAQSKSRMTMLRNEKERMKEYLQELEEIEQRLKKRPLLFERVAQNNARLSAEKHYSNCLRKLGLCEALISATGQNAEYFTDQENENCTEDEVSLEDKLRELWEESDLDDFVS